MIFLNLVWFCGFLLVASILTQGSAPSTPPHCCVPATNSGRAPYSTTGHSNHNTKEKPRNKTNTNSETINLDL